MKIHKLNNDEQMVMDNENISPNCDIDLQDMINERLHQLAALSAISLCEGFETYCGAIKTDYLSIMDRTIQEIEALYRHQMAMRAEGK